MNPLLQAWETTVEDVENVLRMLKEDIALAPEIVDELDHEAIAKAALKAGVEMEEQTEGAYAEIKRQLPAIYRKLYPGFQVPSV